ncbi:MAG TPA: flagellar hook-associated protein FlgK, partial [Novosphingobium sp.]|nr:flagellar hook-associated protein FlgK [Novosphingobium sp.]
MSSDLINIALSGIKAAQAGLDVTSQNISNASTTGYVRRTIDQTDLTGIDTNGAYGDLSLSGVVVTSINRNVDAFQQAEVRRTNADAARADALVTGLTNVNDAIDQSGVYSSITSFQSALTTLASNPTSSSQRANVLEAAKTMAQSFNLASTSLASAISGQQFDANSDVSQINTLAQGLAQLNQKISADTDPATDNATLFDQRDQILQKLSNYTDISTTIAKNGTVSVTMGGSNGTALVAGGTANTLSATTASDGTNISFALNGATITVAGGSLAAEQQTLSAAATDKTALDAVASQMMTAVNTAQTGGADVNGTAGTALFTGTGAGDMAVALTSGDQIVTAASGSAASSQDTTQLSSLRSALSASNGPAAAMNQLLFTTSAAVSGATTTQTALDAIATNAASQLSSAAGVNLNTEAANLVQYQQAFQASGKVIQAAQTIFEQLL